MRLPTRPHTYQLSLGTIQRPLHCKHNPRPSPHFTTHLELYRHSPPQLTKPEFTPPHISTLSKSYTRIAPPLQIKIKIPNLHKELHKKRALHCVHYQTLFPPPTLISTITMSCRETTFSQPRRPLHSGHNQR